MNPIGLIQIIFTPLFLMLFHAIYLRVFVGNPQKRTIEAIGLFCLVSGLVFYFSEPDINLSSIAFFSLCTLGLGHIYFHFFNMSETARRIRILTTLYKTGSLPSEDDYKADHLIQVRLERLKSLNQVELKEGKLYPRWTILRFASIVIKKTEFLLFPERLLN